jgi:hypothetical protein
MPRPSDPGKLAEWRERFERLSSSGLSVVAFCAREGISTPSFYLWRRKLRLNGRSQSATQRHPRHRADPAEGRGRFQRVAVVSGMSPMLSTVREISIQLPGGTRMEVGAVDIDTLRALVAEVLRADRSSTTVRADCGRGASVASC